MNQISPFRVPQTLCARSEDFRRCPKGDVFIFTVPLRLAG